MPRFKLTIEYRGTGFVGWQRQTNGRSVQQAVEEAIRELDPEAPGIAAAGRTDAGVHALGQVAHCDLARAWDGFALMGALNHHLRREAVAVLSAEPVSEDFHARFSAVARHYRYRIVQRRAPLVLEAGLSWRIGPDLDIEAMRAGAVHLIGHHDFTTFRSVQCQSKSPVKTLDAIEIAQDGSHVEIAVRARSFLHNQVRSIVGTLERVGSGKWPPGRVRAALQARDRAACGPVAPACGLYLERVVYP